jgi:hypothetical protein
MARAARNILRRAYVGINQPAGGAVSSAITVTGTVVPNGTTVETAWGTHPVNQPTTGWGAATAVAGTGGGGWTRTTTRPASPGTYYLHVRPVAAPRSSAASAAVIVT